jgi:replicative DNA helicase Mcm
MSSLSRNAPITGLRGWICMASKYEDGDIELFWEDYFATKELELLSLKGEYPQKKHISVSFNDLDFISPEIAQAMLEEPRRFLTIASDVVRKKVAIGDIDIWTTDLPPDSSVEVSKVGKAHLGKMVSISGIVKKISPVMPRVLVAAFKCAKCPGITDVPQDDVFLKYPSQCGACYRTVDTRYTFLPEESEYIDHQWFEIQESPEGLRKGKQPSTLLCYVENSMVNMLTPGRRAIFNGVIELDRKKEKAPATIFTFKFAVMSINSEMEDYDELVITEEEESKIKELAKDPKIYDLLAESIAPAIQGHHEIKEALSLQLFGGVQKVTDDGMVIRGDIHQLLCGDPGIAKSKMLEYMSSMAPRGIYASGKSASAAGLTAAAVKDPFNKDRWCLEAGAMVMADGGFAAIDEMDKMTEDDRSAMHEAMEGQKIHFNKAGICATLSTRCSVLGACNPKYGRFDTYEPYLGQVNMTPTLLSRFDLIHIMVDKGDDKLDAEIAEKMLRNRSSTTPAKEAALSQEFVRKYISIAKKVNPEFSPEAGDLLVKNYRSVRKQGKEKGHVSITPRQMEAYIRLSEASARVRLSPTVEIDDARRAVRLVTNCLNKLCPDGDIDPIMSGTSHKDHDKIKFMKEIIISNGNNMKVDDLKAKCDGRINVEEIDKLLDRMKQAGETIMPRYGYVSLIT